MPYEAEDAAGWDALPTASSDDEPESLPQDSIGPLHTGNEPYVYRSPYLAGEQLTLVAQPEKVSDSSHTLFTA